MATLLDLPIELLLEIQDYLPPDAILSLKLTHPLLNIALPILPKLRDRKLTNCARFAIERYRAQPHESPDHLRCVLCKNIYPTKIFASSSSPACIPLSFVNGAPRPEIVELPPLYCAWHVSRLARVVQTEECVCMMAASKVGENAIATATVAGTERYGRIRGT
ncbi:hypothetical protein K458DRAFT_298334 [Lentithecium fluviatile CBS 122367]|uniref:F-box domain-containing protein n=1 Tax=Lentithecium fluviatile CBS 122367 TaxID=1168545 RepID=A0A6G1J8D7_9PLEO|nr:hypothetical protein K458DRAFT_298334 [Lentithecium fluviatile CBS 122367]